MTRAYLILHVHGSWLTARSASTTKTGDGESGMVSGLDSFRHLGISHTNHAALLVCGVPKEGQSIYLSFYPAGGGFFANGAFMSAETDALFEDASATVRIYRVGGLNGAAMAAFLETLNAQVQRQILIKALQDKLLDPGLAAHRRHLYVEELANQRARSTVGYDAFVHNCTSVVVAALRSGGRRIPYAFLHTPSWLDGVARADGAHYRMLSHADFLIQKEQLRDDQHYQEVPVRWLLLQRRKVIRLLCWEEVG